jgi:hypothetical protein
MTPAWGLVQLCLHCSYGTISWFLIMQLDAAGSWKNYPNIDMFYGGIWKMSQDGLQNSPSKTFRL